VCFVVCLYISTVPNRNSPPANLLREGRREGKKTGQRTLANLSHWPKEKIETFCRLLRDETLVSPQDLVPTRQTLPHGPVEGILSRIGKLELDRLISAQRCRERDLVVAIVVQRLIDPRSRLATTPQWHTTTLAEELGVGDATEEDLYEAMDWLWERQERTEKKLARHLREGGLVLYGAWSSF
jgi:ribosomal protein L35